MPHTIYLGQPPIGISLNAGQEGETVKVACRDLSSSEDGDTFIKKLEDYPTFIINSLPVEERVKISKIDHFLFLIDRGGKCTAYIDELKIVGHARIKKKFEIGEIVYEDDIADIDEIRFGEVDIPSDVGFFVLISSGWRKALYFDLGPLNNPPVERDYNVWQQLGGIANYLAFQHIFKINQNQWDGLLSAGWFPFVGLSRNAVESLINYIDNKWEINPLVLSIEVEVKNRAHSILEHWLQKRILAPHTVLLKQAIVRFLEGDYISSTSILFPRIEGILREISNNLGEKSSKQGILAKSIENTLPASAENFSRLLPSRFRIFLEKVYFASFSGEGSAPLSRNSIAHGVAQQNDFTTQSALLGILIIEQICYHIPEEINIKHIETKT